jgi:hypothetical protein
LGARETNTHVLAEITDDDAALAPARRLADRRLRDVHAEPRFDDHRDRTAGNR